MARRDWSVNDNFTEKEEISAGFDEWLTSQSQANTLFDKPLNKLFN